MLTDMYEESDKRIYKLEEAVPIKKTGKERHGSGRAYSWILLIWDMIIDQLVNGTPPSTPYFGQ